MYLYYISRERVHFSSFSANEAANEERYIVCGYPKNNSQVIFLSNIKQHANKAC